MRRMGLDPNELNAGGTTYDDPELAELDREMKRRGKLLQIRPESFYIKESSVFLIEKGAEGLTDADYS